MGKHPRFSDRVGATQINQEILVESISIPLKNLLWNYIYQSLMHQGKPIYSTQNIKYLLTNYYKFPIDKLPQFATENAEILRNQIFLKESKWYQIYNLIEFINENTGLGELILHTSRTEFQKNINEILEEELSGYRFIDGKLVPITNSTEISCIELILNSEKDIQGVKEHIHTALSLLSQKPSPDYRNSIKESISAVESISLILSGNLKSSFRKALDVINEKLGLHGGFREGILNLYGYASDEDGIRHAILEEKEIGFDEAYYMLITCSAIVNFLISKANHKGLI